MAVTVISGASGALYYKPAGTTGTFDESDVNIATDQITVQPYLNLQVDDPVKFTVVNSQTGDIGTGVLPTGLTERAVYYVVDYVVANGALKVSATEGGSAINFTDTGSLDPLNEFKVAYADYVAIGQVQSWTFEISRDEFDVTTIKQARGQYANFRKYVPGVADGSGTATIYITDDDTAFSNRMIEDVVHQNQAGCAFRLYTEKKDNEILSRSLSVNAVLTSASWNVNPDDAQQVTVAFRLTDDLSFDLKTTDESTRYLITQSFDNFITELNELIVANN